MGLLGLSKKAIGKPLDVTPLSDAEIDALLAEAGAATSGAPIADESLFNPHTHNQALMIRVLATLREMRRQ